MADDHSGPSPPSPLADSPSSSQRTSHTSRQVTRMRCVARSQVIGQRLPVYVDPQSGIASGQNSSVFVSYMGTLAREKISILYAKWEDVPKETKDVLYDDLLVYQYFFIVTLIVINHFFNIY